MLNKQKEMGQADGAAQHTILSPVGNTKKEAVIVNINPGTDLNYFSVTPHAEILNKLLDQVLPISFRDLLQLEEDEKPTKTQFRIKVVETILKLAEQNNWAICKRYDFIYLFNGVYWSLIDSSEFASFLGEGAERMGVKWDYAQDYKFREEMFKQFMAVSSLPTPKTNPDETKINFKNGTLLITPLGIELKKPRPQDFLTYVLPFEYDPQAKAPLFEQYLNQVQPDIERQKILAEYLGYIFVSTSNLKLEKCLLLYGTGANGKSVFFEIVSKLLGEENVSSYSLQSLTNENGYFRAKIANKLVNYASEINGKLEADIFKRLASGEPVEARLPYGEPFSLTNYAKLIFNVNELPKDVEHTAAYFRRFLIVPFEVTIQEGNQDKELSKKIIDNELSGVFNWVMDGLNRLMEQKKFTNSKAVQQQIEMYKKQSDSVQMFLEEAGYETSVRSYRPMKDLFQEYRSYSYDNGYHPCSNRTFGDRLKNAGYVTERKNIGMVIYTQKKVFKSYIFFTYYIIIGVVSVKSELKNKLINENN